MTKIEYNIDKKKVWDTFQRTVNGDIDIVLVARYLERKGGDFNKALAECFYKADLQNRLKLIVGFVDTVLHTAGEIVKSPDFVT